MPHEWTVDQYVFSVCPPAFWSVRRGETPINYSGSSFAEISMAAEILRLAERVKSLENSETRLVAERWEDRHAEAVEANGALAEELKEALDQYNIQRQAAERLLQERDLAWTRLKGFGERITTLEHSEASLKTQVAALEEENASLRRQVGTLEEQMLADRKFALENEKPVYEDLRWHREENKRLRELNAKQAEEIRTEDFPASGYLVRSLRAIREALQTAGLWQPRRDGQGGTGDSAVAAIAQLTKLQEEREQAKVQLICRCGHERTEHCGPYADSCCQHRDCACAYYEKDEPETAHQTVASLPTFDASAPDLNGLSARQIWEAMTDEQQRQTGALVFSKFEKACLGEIQKFKPSALEAEARQRGWPGPGSDGVFGA